MNEILYDDVLQICISPVSHAYNNMRGSNETFPKIIGEAYCLQNIREVSWWSTNINLDAFLLFLYFPKTLHITLIYSASAVS